MSTYKQWSVCPKPNPRARLRLFCFPYAGGGTVIYRPWATGLPETIEVWGIRLPGRESLRAAPLLTRVESLVETLQSALLPSLDMPFAFFGHSMGALLSFELTHALYRRYATLPVHLFVSAHHAPQLPDRAPPLHRLPDDEMLSQLRRLNGTPEAVLQDRELMQLFLPVLRADFAVCETYRYTPRAPLPCPISVFGGLQDPRVSDDELAAWREQTRSTFVHRMLPGDHFFLHSAQTQLLQLIVQNLAASLPMVGR